MELDKWFHDLLAPRHSWALALRNQVGVKDMDDLAVSQGPLTSSTKFLSMSSPYTNNIGTFYDWNKWNESARVKLKTRLKEKFSRKELYK